MCSSVDCTASIECVLGFFFLNKIIVLRCSISVLYVTVRSLQDDSLVSSSRAFTSSSLLPQGVVLPAVPRSPESHVLPVWVCWQEQLLSADQPSVLHKPRPPHVLSLHRSLHRYGELYWNHTKKKTVLLLHLSHFFSLDRHKRQHCIQMCFFLSLVNWSDAHVGKAKMQMWCSRDFPLSCCDHSNIVTLAAKIIRKWISPHVCKLCVFN